MATDMTQKLDEETKKAQAAGQAAMQAATAQEQATPATKAAPPDFGQQAIASGIGSAPKVNFADDSMSGLQTRLNAMEAANGTEKTRMPSISSGVNFGDDSMNGLQTRLSAMQAANGNQEQSSGTQPLQSIASLPLLSGMDQPGKVNYGDDSIAGLNKRIATLQESNGSQGSAAGQAIGTIGKGLAGAGRFALDTIVPSANAETSRWNTPSATASTPSAMAATPSTAAPASVLSTDGQGITSGIDFSSLSAQQRGKEAEALRNRIDQLTGVSSAGAGGLSGMTKRLEAYKGNPSILAMRNTREDILGSGIRLEKNSNGGITITDGGDRTNPLPTAGGSIATLSEGLQRMAGANAARQSMIDSQRTDTLPGGGLVILGDPNAQDRDNAEKTARWANDALINDIRRMDTRTVAGRAKAQHLATALGQQTDAASRRYGYDTQAQTAAAENQVRMRGQDITARGQDIGLQRSADRNEVMVRGQDLRAGTAADRIASNESIAQARINERGDPSLSQQRGNTEIDAARKRVAGLSPEEIQRRTQQFSATGRENKDFDPELARSAKLANRRKVGNDDWFDNWVNESSVKRQEQPLLTRFRADPAMKGRTLGKRTTLGVEVLENGQVVGHYN